MMEQGQSQALDVCVLEVAANLVAEQMLPNDNSDLNKNTTMVPATTDMPVIEHSVTENTMQPDTITMTKAVADVADVNGAMSAAQARKRRKEILTSHRKASSEMEQQQAHHIALNAVLDDPSVEAALAYKRKHEAISKAATETTTPASTEESTNLVPQENPTATSVTAKAGSTSMASSGSSNEGALVTETPTVASSSVSQQQPPMLHAVVTTDSKSKKTQIRYEPTVPMDKDQLTAWRREARRVRNRESAAASRMKTKERIQELEEQVGNWKQKYLDAMDRLRELEGQQQSQGSG